MSRSAPDLGTARVIGSGHTVAMLRRDATVDWWCAPTCDDPPPCWQLLDPHGGVATFPGSAYVDADGAPAGSQYLDAAACGGWRPGGVGWAAGVRLRGGFGSTTTPAPIGRRAGAGRRSSTSCASAVLPPGWNSTLTARSRQEAI